MTPNWKGHITSMRYIITKLLKDKEIKLLKLDQKKKQLTANKGSDETND